MANESESFGENPFRGLDLERFRSNIPKEQEISQEDRALFLRAVHHLPETSERRQKKRGFLLADQCVLPDLTVKKNRPEPPPKPPVAKAAPDEKDEFLLAVRTAKPITAGGRRIARRPEPKEPVWEHADSLENFMAGRLDFAISSTGEYLEGHVAGMDDLVLNRLREGQFSPEAHIDLHGLNATQAFDALKEFIHNSWLKDLRTVLVVTGRGRNSPYGQAVLRQKLQGWLTREPFKRVILAFCTALPHDGGPGSIYVLLRRYRKKGRIQWDRFYMDEDP